jgi:hypothetical protein
MHGRLPFWKLLPLWQVGLLDGTGPMWFGPSTPATRGPLVWEEKLESSWGRVGRDAGDVFREPKTVASFHDGCAVVPTPQRVRLGGLVSSAKG